MAAKIRLKPMGTKGVRFYRIVVMDESAKRDAPAVADLGFYDPKTKPATIKIDAKTLEYWVSKGAAPTPSVRKLLKL